MLWRLFILLIAAFFQFHALVQDNRFHPDEAYFMSFARNAAVNGDWMLSGALDKPPLSIYASALSMMFVGTTRDKNGVLHLDAHQGEFAGRLPNVFVAILLTALIIRLANDLYHNRQSPFIAGLLLATSPYLIVFGASAFTDMMMLFWMIFSVWMLIHTRFVFAGIALSLSFASKEQALFILPLLIALACHFRLISRRSLARFTLPFCAGFLLLLLWDTARPETSIFVLGAVHNSPDHLFAAPETYFNRILVWLDFGSWLLSAGWLTLGLIILALVDYGWRLRKKDTMLTIDSILLIYILTYFGLHTFLAFNQYDRYMLIILPFLVLFVAHGFAQFQKKLESCRGEPMCSPDGQTHGSAHTLSCLYNTYIWRIGGLVLILIALNGQVSQIPIGGDKGEHWDIDELADYLNSKPVATVIYDRWLTWELDYYMGQWSDKRRVHYPTPQALVDGALALDEIGDRYLVTPKNKAVDEWLLALHSAGFGLAEDYQTERFAVYRLIPALEDA